MTTRNFRVHNGISVGDIVISASANTITGMTTSAPSSDGDVSNKKYVDDSIAAISTTAITQGNSNVTVADSGTGNITIEVDGTDRITTVAATTTTATGHSLVIGAGSTSAAGQIKFLEGTDNGTNGVTLIGPASTGDVTVVLPAASDTLVGKATTDTLTNKTLTSAVLNTGVSGTAVLDEDNLASDSATQLATQQSIKAYVDSGLSSLSSTTITAGNTSAVISDSGSDGAFTVTADGNTELVINDTSATFSGNVVITGNLTTNGSTVTNSSTNTTIEDALIELGSGNSGSNTNDLGLILERGSTGNNGFMGWDESEDKFIVGTTTGTGASTGNLTVTTGTLVANIEGNVTGNVTGNTSGSSGSCTGTAAVATTVTAADESSDTSCNVLFVTAATGNLPPKTGTNLTFNSSAGTLTTTTFVGNLTGTATAAEYSDVAERFASDTAYTPGTVVALGGAQEITQVNEEASDEVFGVVSSLQQAAFKMNDGAGNDDTHPYIAMTGRVDVKVIGTVNKGDRLISASVPGYARAATKAECTAFNVIGRALTGKTEAGQGSVLAAVRVSH